jgi:hypothetical protein
MTAPRPKAVKAVEPQDHSEKKVKDPFHFTTKAGAEIVLPAFNSVKPGVVRKVRRLPPVDQFFTTLEMIVGEDVLELIDDLDSEEFEELQTEWFKHSGVDMGE